MQWRKREEVMKFAEFCIWVGILCCCALGVATTYHFRDTIDTAHVNISDMRGACKHAGLEWLK